MLRSFVLRLLSNAGSARTPLRQEFPNEVLYLTGEDGLNVDEPLHARGMSLQCALHP